MTFFSGHGLFVKKVSGSGIVFVTSVGSMMSFEIPEGECHLVTWPEGVSYEIKKASKTWWGSAVLGEGVVATKGGPVTINLQTKSPEELAKFIYSARPPQ